MIDSDRTDRGPWTVYTYDPASGDCTYLKTFPTLSLAQAHADEVGPGTVGIYEGEVSQPLPFTENVGELRV